MSDAYPWMTDALRDDANASLALPGAFHRLTMAAYDVLRPLRSLTEMMRALDASLYAGACRFWLTTHSRLPGSDRTTRLQKKRRTMVFRAYELGDARTREEL